MKSKYFLNHAKNIRAKREKSPYLKGERKIHKIKWLKTRKKSLSIGCGVLSIKSKQFVKR